MEFVAQIEARHRADIILFGARIAHLQLLHRRHEFFAEGVGDVSLNDKTLRCGADLSGILIASGDRRFYRRIQIRILQHDKGIGAAQFQHAFFQRRARLSADRRSGAHAAGHRYRRDARVVNRLADASVSGVDHAEQLCREACLAEELFRQQRAAHHARRMLQQVAVACQQDRNGAAQHLPEWKVPRHDRQYRTERAVFNHRLVVFHLRRLGGEHCRAIVGIPFAQLGRFLDFAARLQDRLAHLCGDGLRHFFAAATNNVSQRAQFVRSRRDRLPAPLLKRLVVSSNRRIYLLFVDIRPGGENFTAGWVTRNRVGFR